MDDTIYSRRLCFEHESGDLLYPVRMKDRDTGVLRFRVGSPTTKRPHELQVDEDEMVRLVLDHDYRVRMKDPITGLHGGYRKTSPSIVGVRRLM